MWIVRLALRRTYTFVVLAVLIAVLGVVGVSRMPTDILPEADVPVVSIVWQYTGMPADEVESRIILLNERVLTASVNDIEHIESQSLTGVASSFSFVVNAAIRFAWSWMASPMTGPET